MEQEIKAIQKQLQQLEERVAVLEGRKIVVKKTEEETQDDIALMIANKANDCEETELIQAKVLDQDDSDAKILLGLYISYKYFKNAWLTSGDIERITSQLGVKVSTSNASQRLKKLVRHLEAEKVRKNGKPTPYRLNRSGSKYFELLLNS